MDELKRKVEEEREATSNEVPLVATISCAFQVVENSLCEHVFANPLYEQTYESLYHLYVLYYQVVENTNLSTIVYSDSHLIGLHFGLNFVILIPNL